MKKEQFLNHLTLFALCFSTCSICNNFDYTNSKVDLPKYSYNDHSNIPGFTWSYGVNDREMHSSSNKGYFYYDSDVYFSQFTTVSRLYLIHNKCQFTSGYIANINGNPDFDSFFDLWSGYVHTSASKVTNGGYHSSSITMKSCWPQSSDFTSVVTSSFGVNYTIQRDIEAGTDLSSGLTITSKTTNSFSFLFDRSVAVQSPEPYLSGQYSPTNSKEAQWNYQYNAVGKATYTLDTYYLFEVKNDASAYQDYSFKFDVSVRMGNIAWQGWLWQTINYTDYTDNASYGLYLS